MMDYLTIACVFLSSFSFLGYSISYFVSSHMKSEFERFGLKKFGITVIFLEILGALGLLTGLLCTPILLISSGGLALLMMLGLITRVRLKDRLSVSFPAIFYMFLNSCIFYLGISQMKA